MNILGLKKKTIYQFDLFTLYGNSYSYLVVLKVLGYIKGLLLRCIHHFNSDLINDMEHMRISGMNPH